MRDPKHRQTEKKKEKGARVRKSLSLKGPTSKA